MSAVGDARKRLAEQSAPHADPTAAAVRAAQGADGPCETCGQHYPAWRADNVLWNLVMGGPDATDDPGGMLCPVCFLRLADERAPIRGAWVVGTPVRPEHVVAAESLRLAIADVPRLALTPEGVRRWLRDRADRLATDTAAPEGFVDGSDFIDSLAAPVAVEGVETVETLAEYLCRRDHPSRWEFSRQTLTTCDDCTDVAATVEASPWLAARIVQARAGEGALREAWAEVKRDHTMPPNKDRRGYDYRMGWWDAVVYADRLIQRRIRAALTTAEPGLPGYFIAPDGFGAPVIWHGTGPNDPTCRPVLEGWRVQAVAPDLWAAITALVEGKS